MPTRTPTSRVSRQIMQRIRSGQWAVDDVLPPERDLAVQWKVSRNTVRAAMRRLEDRGVLKAVQGSGRRVHSPSSLRNARIALLTHTGIEPIGQAARYGQGVMARVHDLEHHLITYAVSARRGGIVDTADHRMADFDSLDGAIVFAHQYEDRTVIRLMDQLPLVVMARDATAVGAPSYFIDMGFHAALAVRELAAMGHRRIAVIGPPSAYKPSVDAMVRRGFDLSRHLAGLPLDPRAFIHRPVDADESFWIDLLDQWRQQGWPFSAVLTTVDEPLEELVRLSRRMGDDLAQRMSMVCLADLSNRQGQLQADYAHFLTPAERIGADAVQGLHDQLHGIEPDRIDHAYYGTLQPGATFRPPPTTGQP